MYLSRLCVQLGAQYRNGLVASTTAQRCLQMRGLQVGFNILEIAVERLTIQLGFQDRYNGGVLGVILGVRLDLRRIDGHIHRVHGYA